MISNTDTSHHLLIEDVGTFLAYNDINGAWHQGIIREHVKISTLDENVNRLTFEPDPPPPLKLKPNIEYVYHT